MAPSTQGLNQQSATKREKSKDPLVEVFKRICPALVPDGKRKTLIVRLGTALAFPVALAAGLFWYYTQRGPSEKMKAYYKRLEQMYEDYDYEEDLEEPAWSNTSWIVLFATICFIVSYAFKSLIFKTSQMSLGQGDGMGEGLRQWVPRAGSPNAPPPPGPAAVAPAGDPRMAPQAAVGPASPSAGVGGSLRIGQEQPNIMNPDYHQRRLGTLNSSPGGAPPPGVGARVRFQPSAYRGGQTGF